MFLSRIKHGKLLQGLFTVFVFFKHVLQHSVTCFLWEGRLTGLLALFLEDTMATDRIMSLREHNELL